MRPQDVPLRHTMACLNFRSSDVDGLWPVPARQAPGWGAVTCQTQCGPKFGRAFLFLNGFKFLIWVVVALYLISLASVPALADDPASEKERDQFVPVRLRIPAIDLNSEVTPVQSNVFSVDGKRYRQWDTSDNLIGWHNLSARLGEKGNTVLAGHSNVYAQVFQNLDQVSIGDEVEVLSESRAYRYIITHIAEVQEQGVSFEQRLENGKWINRTEDERLTLVTCSRPGATHRTIVVAYPAPPIETDILVVETAIESHPNPPDSQTTPCPSCAATIATYADTIDEAFIPMPTVVPALYQVVPQ